MILSLQYLRGIASLMVVYFHVGTQISRLRGNALPLTEFGRFGVDIFFVISGIVMWITTRDGRTNPGTFLIKRILRIGPLYWTVTLAVAAMALLLSNVQSSTIFDTRHLIASLLFVPWPHPVFGVYAPVVIPGWTLNYEMLFYAVFAVALFAPARFRILVTFACLLGLLVLGHFWGSGGIVAFYAEPIILEFGFGMLIGAVSVTGRFPHPGASLLGAAVGVIVLAGLNGMSDLHHVLTIGIPVALIVGGIVLFERARPIREVAILSRIGDASYSIYLTHVIVLPAVTLAWTRLEIGASGARAIAFYALSMIVATMAGMVAHRFLEMPLTARIHALVPLRKRPAQLA